MTRLCHSLAEAQSTLAAAIILAFALTPSPASAQVIERGMQGGVAGAIIGGIVGGGRGAGTRCGDRRGRRRRRRRGRSRRQCAAAAQPITDRRPARRQSRLRHASLTAAARLRSGSARWRLWPAHRRRDQPISIYQSPAGRRASVAAVARPHGPTGASVAPGRASPIHIEMRQIEMGAGRSCARSTGEGDAESDDGWLRLRGHCGIRDARELGGGSCRGREGATRI